MNTANDKAVLISIHPEHVQKILTGEKCLEFRRRWTAQHVSKLVIYATAPTRKIVAIAEIKTIHIGNSTALWQKAKELGGGLTRERLIQYFAGVNMGFAIELGKIRRFHSPVNPQDFFPEFYPPQSFSFVPENTLKSLQKEYIRQKNFSKSRVLFVAGVHGVGKSTLCENFSKTKNVMFRSAGKLIAEAKKIESLTKTVADVDGNQNLLVNQVRRIRDTGSPLILDGHFAVFNTKLKPVPVASSVFSDLGVDGVILITDRPDDIANRLASRDGKSIDISAIAALQKVEEIRAKQVAKELCVPFAKIKPTQYKLFFEKAELFLS